MEYLENVAQNVRNKVQLNRTLWLSIISVAVILGVALWITLSLYPQHGKLWILFLYTIPAELLIGIIPHEPIIFYYSKLYHPFTVTWVTLISTILTEYLNYTFVTLFFKIPQLDNLMKRRTFQKAKNYFLSAPFVSLTVAAITPVPFFPFRVIAPMSRYPMKKYLLAIFVGRTPRFYVLAYFGYIVVLPNEIIILLFILLFALIIISRIREKAMNKKL